MTDLWDDFEKNQSAFEAQIMGRQEESAQKRDDTGLYRDIFLPGIPGLKIWRPKSGDHEFDLVPYKTGENDPTLPPGTWTYLLEVWTHGRVGPSEDTYVCMARTFREKKNPKYVGDRIRCPICEARNKLRDEGCEDEELMKSLLPSRRTIYNVVAYTPEQEEQKGTQVWEVAYFFMEMHINALFKKRGRGGVSTGERDYLAHPTKGKTICFTRQGKGKGNVSFIGHRLQDRNYALTKTDLEQAKSLDEIVHLPTYEEVYKSFYAEGLPESGPVAEEQPTTRRRHAATEQPTTAAPEAAPAAQPTVQPRRQAEAPPAQQADPTETQGEVNKCPEGYVFGGPQAEESDGCQKCPEAIWAECVALKVKQATSAAGEPAPSRRTG